MASYNFYFLECGQIVGNASREFANDLDAVDKARTLAKGFEIDIWLDDKWIARVNEAAEPLNIREQMATQL
jgi:hypothetical protein